MRLITLDRMSEEYSSSLKRLESWGVRVVGTRLDTYCKLLKNANAQERDGDESHQSDERFRNAIVEASDVIDITRLDSSLFVGSHVLEKLKQISGGNEFAEDEGADPGRDYAFEFACARDVHEHGHFGGFSSSAGDLLVSPGLWPIENKRISSLTKLEQRIRKARDQLQCGFKAGGPPGLIALDLSRPIRRTHGHLAAVSDDALIEATSKTLSAYIGKHLMRAIRPEDAARLGVLGIMVRYVSVGTAGDTSRIRRSTTWQLVSLHNDHSAENKLFLNIAALCGSAPIVDGTLEELVSARASMFSRQ